ncbi:MAG: Two component signal transduction histidine kinase [Blastococcus sp.]|jgi:hypothetical protein|nr:Two component signal transduction histidine kinase [Blastococcus sp.]
MLSTPPRTLTVAVLSLAITVALSGAATLIAVTDGAVERRGEPVDIGLERPRDAAAGADGGSLDGMLDDRLSVPAGRDDKDDTVPVGLP